MTGAGHLAEATTVIQRMLGAAPDEAEPADRAAPAKARAKAAEATRPALEPMTARPNAAARPGEGAGLRATLRRLAERAGALGVEAPDTAPRPEGARFVGMTYANGVGARDYKLYVPAAVGGAGPRPLIVMLHGCSQNPDDFARGTGMNVAAEEADALVVYPSQPSSANPNRCWNWFRPEDQRREAGEPAIIAGIVRAVMAAEDVDPARVYVAGMSAGGAAAAILGVEYPDVFAAVGVHSGLPHGAAKDLPSALSAMRQGARGRGSARAVRTIVFHGDADRVVNPANGAALAAHATAAGDLRLESERGAANGRSFSRARHADAKGRPVCEHWTIHGAGHAWAGGNAAGTHTDPLGPDASREMLRFFLET